MKDRLHLIWSTVTARAYPRIISLYRTPSWLLQETLMPFLSVCAFVYIYRAMHAPEEFVGFVILGGAMTAFWLNVLWSMGAQFYWERDNGNLELFILAPGPLMAILAGMALGGIVMTTVRAVVIIGAGIVLFDVPFHPSSWGLLILVFGLTLTALYGLGMVFASVFLVWGREAWHFVNLLQEPVYFMAGVNYPLRVLPSAVALVASALPLAIGMDAMRSILFATEPYWPFAIELGLLMVSSIFFLVTADRCLASLERRAKVEGRLSLRWQ